MNIISREKAEYISHGEALGIYKDRVFILDSGCEISILSPYDLERVKRGYFAVRWYKVKPINLENE